MWLPLFTGLIQESYSSKNIKIGTVRLFSFLWACIITYMYDIYIGESDETLEFNINIYIL